MHLLGDVFEAQGLRKKLLKGSWRILQLFFIVHPSCSSRIQEECVIVIPSFTLIQVLLFHHKFIFNISMLLLFTVFSDFLVLELCISITVIVIGISNCMSITTSHFLKDCSKSVYLGCRKYIGGSYIVLTLIL